MIPATEPTVGLRSTASRGQALVDALAALVLLGAASAIVAAAAAASLRATHQAELLQRLVAVGARELAGLQLGDAQPAESEHPLSEPGLSGATVSRTVARPGGALADLAVSVTAGSPQQRIQLNTRVLVNE